MIVVCGMTSFAMIEPVSKPDAKGFATALMRILLRFGMCHTIVIDKGSAFFGVFLQLVELLDLNSHVLSGDNHDAMLVERVNVYLNKGLRIMTNERESIRVACEAILLLLYAWNAAPVPGTDIPRSLVVTGRVFSFPIDFNKSKHLELTTSPDAVQSYAKDQAKLLSASHDIAKVLVEEQRSWHRELINARQPDPRLYEINDIVFARRATKSDARKERVGKLMYKMTGPWRVISKLSGASYRLESVRTPGRFIKKHASDLSPHPLKLVPFEPIDGTDTRFSNINKTIQKNPFIEAGIDGYDIPEPFKLPDKLPANFLHGHDAFSFEWPTVAELNEEMFPFPWLPGERENLLMADSIEAVPVMYDGPPPPPQPPDITVLASSIIASINKLFFISHSIGSSTYREWKLI